MIDSMHVLDVLRERGYEPQSYAEPPGEGWFILRGEARSVRVVLYEDGSGGEVHAFTGPMVNEWSSRAYGNAAAPLLALMDAAEQRAQT